MISYLAAKEPAQRIAVAQAHGELGSAKAIDTLIALLHDSDSGVRDSAAQAMAKLSAAMTDPQKLAYSIGTKSWDDAAKFGKAAVDPLISCLADADPTVRADAVGAIGMLQGKQAVPSIISCLKDEDPSVRLSSALALGELQDERAIDPLIAGLSDTDSTIRSKAAQELGELGYARAVAPLFLCLTDPDPDVRKAAVKALAALKDAMTDAPKDAYRGFAQ